MIYVILAIALALFLFTILALLRVCGILGMNVARITKERDEARAREELFKIRYDALEIHTNALRVQLGLKLSTQRDSVSVEDFRAALNAQRKDGATDA